MVNTVVITRIQIYVVILPIITKMGVNHPALHPVLHPVLHPALQIDLGAIQKPSLDVLLNVLLVNLDVHPLVLLNVLPVNPDVLPSVLLVNLDVHLLALLSVLLVNLDVHLLALLNVLLVSLDVHPLALPYRVIPDRVVQDVDVRIVVN
jgi:hypothetical protein